jgi:sugar O-acyltransferase (sialic acid O-acetyltransferase NeuD family)
VQETHIGLIGSGSQALEVLDFSHPGFVSFLLSSNKDHIGSSIKGVTVFDFAEPGEEITSLGVIAAVGAPGLKRKLLSQWNGQLAEAVSALTAYVSPNSTVGLGTIIAPNAVVMTNVQIGESVLINTGATVSHDTVIGDYSTISPGVNIGGNCKIQDGVFVGIGATIIQGVEIAAGSYIGAGAVVTKNITKPGTYVGVPAQFLNENNVWTTSL